MVSYLNAAQFDIEQPVPLEGVLHDRGFLSVNTMVGMRGPDGIPFKSATLAVTHPRVKGLCVAIPCVGWWSVTHIASGRSIGTAHGVDFLHAICTLLRYGVIAQYCGFSFDGTESIQMAHTMQAHSEHTLPFPHHACTTIGEYRTFSQQPEAGPMDETVAFDVIDDLLDRLEVQE